MYLRVIQGESKEWHVQLVGNNGEVVMSSENYDSKDNARRAAQTIKDFRSGHELEIIVKDQEIT